ncbi:MAG: BF3164 family lipoprotein [Marinifilaceae bacterium]
MRYLAVCLLGILLLGCTPSPVDDPLADFNKIDYAKPQKTFEGIKLYNPTTVLIKDSLGIFWDWNGENYLTCYDLKQQKAICAFGKKGNGPGEILRPFRLDWNRNKSEVDVYVIELNQIHSYQLKDLVDSVIVDRKQKVKPTKANFRSAIYINDSLVMGEGYFFGCENRFGLYNLKSKKFTGFAQYPEDDHPETISIFKSSAYQCILMKHPSKEFVLAANGYSPMFDIIDVSTQKIIHKRHYKYPDYVPPASNEYTGKISVPIKRTNIDGFAGVDVTEEKIYMLFSGRTYEEYKDRCQYGNFILVYDWEGNPLKAYQVDLDLKSIAVDEKLNRIYAIAVDDEYTSKLVQYSLN